jgi:hypothetical protein
MKFSVLENYPLTTSSEYSSTGFDTFVKIATKITG